MAYTQYSLDGGAFAQGSQCVVSTTGSHTLAFHSVDNAGNLEAMQTAGVNIDLAGPLTAAKAKVIVKHGRKATFRFRVSDLTPTASVKIKIYKGSKVKKTLNVGSKPTGSWQSYKWTCKLAEGSYTWKVYATDLAGNVQKSIAKKALVVN